MRRKIDLHFITQAWLGKIKIPIIARATGLSYETVLKIAKRLGLPPRKQPVPPRVYVRGPYDKWLDPEDKIDRRKMDDAFSAAMKKARR